LRIRYTVIDDASSCLIDYVFEHLPDLETEYPNFKNWYYGKVCAGLASGSRKIILASSENNNDFAGVVILKNTFQEKKICTLRVDKECRFLGIGSNLIETSLKELGRHPLITVPEEHLFEFDKLLSKYDFKRMYSYRDYYLKGHIEYTYNGYLIDDRYLECKEDA